jgi:phage shock protein PspC (stress-responsive transcriptional regulator)
MTQTPDAPRRLYRSRIDRRLAGICGGFADYFGIDPVIVRLICVAFALLSGGIGILLYVVAIFVVPNDPRQPTAHAG